MTIFVWIIGLLVLWGLFGFVWSHLFTNDDDDDDDYHECPYE